MTTEHDDDLDFAMLTPPTRPGPCKSASAPEVDPVEARIERERQAAKYRCCSPVCKGYGWRASEKPHPCPEGIEVRHGSGKVKV
jgi:hypothetical protein